MVGAWRGKLDPDMDGVKVNGGALALGHLLGGEPPAQLAGDELARIR